MRLGFFSRNRSRFGSISMKLKKKIEETKKRSEFECDVKHRSEKAIKNRKQILFIELNPMKK